MPTYPTYKLGEICVIERGGSPRPIKDYLTRDDNGLNWIKIGDATSSNKYIYTTAEKIKPEGLSKTRKVESGDLILSNSMSFGHPYIMRTSGCIHDGWVVFRLNKDIIDEEYLYNILNSNKVYAQFNHLATGSTVKNLNIDRVKEVVIPLPPLPIQHAIVTRIESLFAELDKGVEHLRNAQQQLKTYRQAVLNYWLNNDDGKWEMVNISCFLDKSCKGMMTGPFGTALKKTEHKNSGVPVLGIENIGEGSFVMPNKIFVTEEKAKELKNFVVKADDIIISRSGTVGEICKVPPFMNDALLSTNLIRIRLNLDIIYADYYVLLFQSSQIKQQVKDLCKGTTRAFLNQTILNQISFPLPPLYDQHRIVKEIESRLSQAEIVEASIEKALQQSEALRQSILKKAFSGELV